MSITVANDEVDPDRNCSNRILVLYKTKYGSTKLYAGWIADELGSDLCEMTSFDPCLLGQYDTVLLGSPAYLGGLRCRGFLKRHWAVLRKKRIIVFGVTGVPPEDPRQQQIVKRSFPEYIRNYITYFPLRGAFNYSQLGWFDKIIMSGPIVRFQLRWWLARDRKARERLHRFCSPMDWTNKSAAASMCQSMGLTGSDNSD
jgi:menaquinone-dependent protoporphyrinogen IX oxidase